MNQWTPEQLGLPPVAPPVGAPVAPPPAGVPAPAPAAPAVAPAAPAAPAAAAGAAPVATAAPALPFTNGALDMAAAELSALHSALQNQQRGGSFAAQMGALMLPHQDMPITQAAIAQGKERTLNLSAVMGDMALSSERSGGSLPALMPGAELEHVWLRERGTSIRPVPGGKRMAVEGTASRVVYIPGKELQMAAATIGSSAVPDRHADDIIPYLYHRAPTLGMCDVRSNLEADETYPRSATALVPAWNAKGNVATETTASIDAVQMEPHQVSVKFQATVQDLIQFGGVRGRLSDQFLREANMAMGQMMERGVLVGLGSSNQPKGILAYAGTTVALSNANTVAGRALINQLADYGDSLGLKTLAGMEDATFSNAAPEMNQHYITSPAVRTALRTSQAFSGSHMSILAEHLSTGGAGVMRTIYMPADQIIFGSWMEMLVGVWDGLYVVMDEVTSPGNVLWTLIRWYDTAPKHTKSFCVAKKDT